MGNKVSAAGPSDVPAPPMPGMPPPPSAAGPSSQAGSNPEPASPPSPPADTGPGKFEDMNNKTKEIFPTPFEGAKVIVNKGLSNHFQIGHSLTMSNLQPSGYKFNCTYVGANQGGTAEPYPVLVGELDPSGNLNAQIFHQFAKNLRSRFVAQIQGGKWVGSQVSNDYTGKDFCFSLAFANPDLLNGSGVGVVQYMQNVTQKFAMGTELVYNRSQQVPGGQMAVYSIGGRYSGDNWQASTKITPQALGVNCSYYHKVTENLQMGVELEGAATTQEYLCTIGYQQDIPSANLVFKGQIDTNWCVAGVLEKRLLPLPFTFSMSALANHVKGTYRFGVGLLIG